VAKLIVSVLALQALAAHSCDELTTVNSLGSGDKFGTQVFARTDAPGSRESAPAAADCPASVGANSAGDGAVLWLSPFDADPATSPSSVAVDAGNDVFMTKATGEVRKLSGADGSLRWSKPFGSLVAVAPGGDVFVAGTFSGTLVLDATTLSAAGGTDAFLAVLDGDGNVTRAFALGGPGDETAQSLAVDANGRAFVSGSGLGTLAVDTAGATLWRKTYAGNVATDATGNVVVAGGFTGSVDFGAATLTSEGGKDVFVVKLDGNGIPLFARRFGDAGTQQEAQAISIDAAGNPLIAGVFDGTIDFGTGALTMGSCPSEAWCKTSGFIAELDADGAAVWSRARGPMRAFSSIAAGATGTVLASGAEPGDADPYRMPLLLALDASGQKVWERREWPDSGV
jgi:hypothetical protein